MSQDCALNALLQGELDALVDVRDRLGLRPQVADQDPVGLHGHRRRLLVALQALQGRLEVEAEELVDPARELSGPDPTPPPEETVLRTKISFSQKTFTEKPFTRRPFTEKPFAQKPRKPKKRAKERTAKGQRVKGQKDKRAAPRKGNPESLSGEASEALPPRGYAHFASQ